MGARLKVLEEEKGLPEWVRINAKGLAGFYSIYTVSGGYGSPNLEGD
jgi:hypothetical protein